MIIYIIIPAYNEEATIGEVIKSLSKYSKNIIVVDDNSNDNTPKIIDKLRINKVTNSINLGYAKSLEKGISSAFNIGADYVITFDADGQHISTDLQKFFIIIHKFQPDIIIGQRRIKNRIMEKLLGFYTKKKFGVSDPLCGMKAYKKSVFEKYRHLERRYTIGIEMSLRAIKEGASFYEVGISSKERSDSPRFGNFIKGNLLEFIAFINIIRI